MPRSLFKQRSMTYFRKSKITLLSFFSISVVTLHAQRPDQAPHGPGGDGPNAEEREILKQFDKDKNKYLDRRERAEARAFLKENSAPAGGGPGGRPGGRRGPRVDDTPPTPGIKISPDDVERALSGDLYATNTLRTLFITFENDDWEAELEAFHNTDVDVPATLMVDGETYEGVGIRFRGKSSYFMVPAGRKRSFNLSVDMVEKKQRVDGYKTLNLLNCNGDGSFLSGPLYSDIARQYIPAPKANHVRVVVNGENWGVYVNQQQFNKDFILENYRTSKGARWKVPGSPRGRGGLDYIGENIEDYEERYEMKSGDEEDWKALIKLCKTITETPLDELEVALEPLLDLDGALWFLALDCALINSDGYWTRASDYSIYRSKDGRFHLMPHDMNEAFRPARQGGPSGRGGRSRGGPSHEGGRSTDGGPEQEGAERGGPERGGPERGGPERGGPERGGRSTDRGPERGGPPTRSGSAPANGLHLDPLIALGDAEKPLRSRLLAVPALRERYLEKVRHIAEHDLDWKRLGPQVAAYRALIGKEVAVDTRKTSTTADFEALTADTAADPKEPKASDPRGGGSSLRSFADGRRAFLLNPPSE